MKQFIQGILRSAGYELHRLHQPLLSVKRPISDCLSFLEDVQARGFEPAGFVDVGANRGEWARMALSIFPGIPGILVEPQDEMEPPLSALCREVPALRYVKAGAGKAPAELVQTIYDDFAGSTFLQPTDADQLRTGRQRRTPIVTLDSILARPENRDLRPDLVKLDIQGFELEALKGGESLFGRAELFVLETSLFPFMPGQPITREVIEFMAQRGYEIYDITGHIRRPLDSALGQVDFAFARRDGKLRANTVW